MCAWLCFRNAAWILLCRKLWPHRDDSLGITPTPWSRYFIVGSPFQGNQNEGTNWWTPADNQLHIWSQVHRCWERPSSDWKPGWSGLASRLMGLLLPWMGDTDCQTRGQGHPVIRVLCILRGACHLVCDSCCPGLVGIHERRRRLCVCLGPDERAPSGTTSIF